MALIWINTYPAQAAAADLDYPFSSAQNVTVAGDGTGTPWDYQIVNDWAGFFQRLLVEGSITPSGDPDTVLASDYFDGFEAYLDARTPGAWVAMTLLNGWVADRARYRLIDGGSRLEIDIHELNGAASTSVQVFLLPAGFRPVDEFSLPSTSTTALYVNQSTQPDYISTLVFGGVTLASYLSMVPMD